MTAPRLRIVLPVAFIVALAGPLLRSLPNGEFIPDLLLLLLLVVTPVRVDRLRTTVFLLIVFGLLRCSLSAVPIWSCWAGLGFGLALRALFHHHVSDSRFIGRLLVGIIAAVPLSLFDAHAANLIGVNFAPGVLEWRVVWLAVAWALLQTPPSWRRPARAI
ncbi:MAG: hypothetical protein COB96_02060 [Planctomycetota bacterium]|jgi:hypothetical protein|nr:MAG: hypothetical protein COB96_02060 [Planctomycetota bacterium]